MKIGFIGASRIGKAHIKKFGFKIYCSYALEVGAKILVSSYDRNEVANVGGQAQKDTV